MCIIGSGRIVAILQRSDVIQREIANAGNEKALGGHPEGFNWRFFEQIVVNKSINDRPLISIINCICQLIKCMVGMFWAGYFSLPEIG